MLVLSRYPNQRIRIQNLDTGDTVWLHVLEVRGDKVRLGITAPARMVIAREELIPPTEREDDPHDAA